MIFKVRSCSLSSVMAVAEESDRSVVHRRTEGRSRGDQAVQERYVDADGCPGTKELHDSGLLRAMEVENAFLAPVDHGDDEGLPILHEADVGDESRIEDGVHGGLVVARFFPQSTYPVAILNLVVRHLFPYARLSVCLRICGILEPIRA